MIDIDVEENYVHEGLVRHSTRAPLQLDIYLPNEKLAFEYQGEQHFNDIHAVGSKWIQQRKDDEKRRLCTDNDITLIEIPYWWDNEKSSLMATIHKYRPDLIPLEMVGNGIAIEIDQESPSGILFWFSIL